MGPVLDLNMFARLADRRLDKVKEDYLPKYQDKINQIFGTQPLDKAFYEYYEVGSLPDIPVFTGKVDFLSQDPGFYTRIEPKEYVGGVAMTKKMMEDNQYNVFKNRQTQMVTSYGRTKEKAAAKLLGNAFSASWDYMYTEEGVSLCNSSHLTKSQGVSTSTGFGNAGSSALSPTSLAATRILFNKFRNDIGEYYNSEANTIIVPQALYDTACEITGYDPRNGAESGMDMASANRKINVLYKAFTVIPWLRLDDYSTKNWFMTDMSLEKEMLVWIDRVPFETESRTDFMTYAFQQKGRGRFGCGYLGWRFCYGHQVS